MYKKLLVIGIALAMAGSASALVVNDTQTWGDRTAIHELSDATLEIGPLGNLTINNRVDCDGPGQVIMNGGTLTINDTFKMPDDNATFGPTIILNSGLLTAGDCEWYNDRGAVLNVGDGVMITGDTGSSNRNPGDAGIYALGGDDPIWNMTLIAPMTEVVIEDLGGNVKKIYATPEPATIGLLGLGSLILFRRKK